MKKKILVAILFAVYAFSSKATINQIRWGSSGDPLHGLTVTWSSSGSADSVKWGYTTSFEKGSFVGTKRAGYTSGISFFKYQFPTVTASSTIYYKFYDSNGHSWTTQNTFTTAPDPTLNTYSFGVLGDCRDYPATLTTISNLVAARKPAITLFNGDLTLDGTSASEYNTFFSAAANFLQNSLVYHAEGNHDAYDASLFSNLWDIPTTSGTNLYYSVRYGNAVFITLNTCDPTNATQLSWLQTTLANAAADPTVVWKIISLHHAFFTVGNHAGDMNSYRSTIWKAFDDYGVDFVFTGHDHNYQRSKPVNLNISSTAPVSQYGSGTGQGRCEIVSGGAGAGLYTQGSTADAWAMNLFNSTYNYVFCNVNGCKISVKAYDQNNAIIDSVTITKTGVQACSTTDINNKQTFNPIKIFPNPVENNFTLQYSSEQMGDVSIRIFDSMGKEVETLKTTKTQTELSLKHDMSKHAKGIYTVSVMVGNQRDNAMLILTK
jgi:hypothetical protein